jgi:GMP reductase
MEIFDYDNILLLPRKCRVDSRSRMRHLGRVRPARFAAGGAGQHEDGGRRAHRELAGRSGHFYVMHRFDLDNVALRGACATRACSCRSARA